MVDAHASFDFFRLKNRVLSFLGTLSYFLVHHFLIKQTCGTLGVFAAVWFIKLPTCSTIGREIDLNLVFAWSSITNLEQSMPGDTYDRTCARPYTCKIPSTREKSPMTTSLSIVQSHLPNRNFVIETAKLVDLIFAFRTLLYPVLS